MNKRRIRKKKKWLAAVLALSLAAAGPALSGGGAREVLAETVISEEFTINAKGALTKYNGAGGSVVIPDSVTSIGLYAFSGCSGLREVTIPSSVKLIGGYAFNGCSGLQEVTIPGSVMSIGDHAFSGCSGLREITIPGSVKLIGSSAFDGCSGLQAIAVDKDNETYDSRGNSNAIIRTETNELIAGCQNTVIPDDVTSIGYSAFMGCSGLGKVTIPSSVTSIRSYAFSGCSGLREVTIPSSVTSIGTGVFSGCSGLQAMTVDKDNKAYDSRDNSNAIIETETNELIAGCQNTVIPNDVTSIRNWAFRKCSGLSEVTIPSSVTSIGEDVFAECSGLQAMTVDKDNKVYDSRGNSNAIIRTETNELIAGCQNTVIPDSVTSIGDHAFYGCSGLSEVTIPGSVTGIGWYAFNECSGLRKVTIPGSVTSIGWYAFNECSGLQEVTILSGVASIGNGAFYGCSGLGEVTIPSSVTSIESRAFSGCSEELLIIGQTGSHAQEYAQANNLRFMSLDREKGDVDGSQELSIEDAQLALKAALRITVLDVQAAWAADVDGESGISLNDVLLILKRALKITAAF